LIREVGLCRGRVMQQLVPSFKRRSRFLVAVRYFAFLLADWAAAFNSVLACSSRPLAFWA